MKVKYINIDYSNCPSFGYIICENKNILHTPVYNNKNRVSYFVETSIENTRLIEVTEIFDLNIGDERIFSYYHNNIMIIGHKKKIKQQLLDLVKNDEIKEPFCLLELINFLKIRGHIKYIAQQKCYNFLKETAKDGNADLWKETVGFNENSLWEKIRNCFFSLPHKRKLGYMCEYSKGITAPMDWIHFSDLHKSQLSIKNTKYEYTLKYTIHKKDKYIDFFITSPLNNCTKFKLDESCINSFNKRNVGNKNDFFIIGHGGVGKTTFAKEFSKNLTTNQKNYFLYLTDYEAHLNKLKSQETELQEQLQELHKVQDFYKKMNEIQMVHLFKIINRIKLNEEYEEVFYKNSALNGQAIFSESDLRNFTIKTIKNFTLPSNTFNYVVKTSKNSFWANLLNLFPLVNTFTASCMLANSDILVEVRKLKNYLTPFKND